ncbi:hypothetical protein BS78_03G143000 [Paspalum vaginatum]|nr:hypothetical protein BS78_03G143000 [Paspalum vaginatum]
MEKRCFLHARVFFIEWNGFLVIVTSASLVRNSGGCEINKIVENLTIMVSLPDGHHKEGQLENYSLHFNISLVSVPLRHDHAFRPAEVLVDFPMVCHVAAVGRCFVSGGALMATTGKLVPRSGTLDCKLLTYSKCKITKAGIGGPVVTLDGHVLGMNFYDKIGTPFMSWDWISGVLKSFGNSNAGEVDSTGVQFSSTFVLDSDDVKSIGGELCDGSLGHYYKIAATDKNRLNRWPLPMPCWRRPCDHADEDIVEDDSVTYFGGVRYMLF